MKPGMGKLQLDIPIDTLKRLKIVSALRGKTMKEIVLPLIEKEIGGLRLNSNQGEKKEEENK